MQTHETMVSAELVASVFWEGGSEEWREEEEEALRLPQVQCW